MEERMGWKGLALWRGGKIDINIHRHHSRGNLPIFRS